MNLQELKAQVNEIEKDLDEYPVVKVAGFSDGNRNVHVYLTNRLKKKCKKGKVWKSKEFLITLMNAKYGYNEEDPKSRGGRDGIFLVDRNFRPPNEMQRKLFDQFIDSPGNDYNMIIQGFDGVNKKFLPIRVVSHHMRLLGLLLIEKSNHVILVDFDKTK